MMFMAIHLMFVIRAAGLGTYRNVIAPAFGHGLLLFFDADHPSHAPHFRELPALGRHFMVNKTIFCLKTIIYAGHSHSIVAGGFPEMS
jgi:hypothetical protein